MCYINNINIKSNYSFQLLFFNPIRMPQINNEMDKENVFKKGLQ